MNLKKKMSVIIYFYSAIVTSATELFFQSFFFEVSDLQHTFMEGSLMCLKLNKCLVDVKAKY